MGIAKKVRKKRKTAPLSVLDKCIYVGVILLILGTTIVCAMTFSLLFPNKITFSVPGIISVSSRVSWINILPISFVGLMLAIPPYLWLDKKLPLFGNKRFKQSGKYPAIKLTPLFTKKFFTELTNKKRKYIRIYCIALVIIFLVSAVVVSLCICPRKTLDENGNFATYDSFNNITHESKLTNAKCFTVYVEEVYQRRRSNYHRVAVEFTFADDSYTFSLEQFANLSTEEAVKYLLDVKEDLGSGRFRVENAEDIEKVFEYYDYSENEKDLIRELFDCDD